MWISINWLRELVDINQSPEELAETLTMAGFEVEEIENRASWADGVVVGKVLKRDRHPNADKLSVCTVDVGADEPLNIVCGAPNVRADAYVPVATVGTYLPKVDLKIKPAKLRGVASSGMICSLAELGLAKDSEGIHIFSGDNLEVGSDARPLLGLDDVLLDLSSTANRADALSMVGVAREVAALTGATVRLPKAKSVSSVKAAGPSLQINLQDSPGCPAYIGTLIAGVKIGPSPAWLQQRLEGSRIRPINNVVDVTNYVLLEWGQPLHAFDADKLKAVAGGVRDSVAEQSRLTIGVRFAQPGETMKTLDEQDRKLEAETLLITANDRPVALGGVMGGEATEVDDETQNLMLEAALFESATIRRSARSQGLRSESSNRYERGVNQAGLEEACRRAIELITQLAGGEAIGQDMTDKRSTEIAPINLRLDRVNQVLGPTKAENGTGSLKADEIEHILNALGCQISPTRQKDVWSVTVPPYRARDLEREIDLIEEIARLHGYDNFCDTLPSKTAAGGLSVEQQTLRDLRTAFRGAGLTELMHYSLVKPGETNQVELSNPLFAEYSALRTQMLSGLIDAFQQNQDQGNGALNGFEIGQIFWKEGEALKEKEAIAGILGGDPTVGRWVRSGKEQPMTWYEAKGLLDSIFERVGVAVEYRPWGNEAVKNQLKAEAAALCPEFASATLHPGRTASLWLWGKCLGVFGQLHPQLRQQRELIDEVYVFQLDLGLLVQAASKNTTQKFAVYSTFPASDRDLAFFSPVDLSVADLQKVMVKAGGKLLETVQLFDEYQGKNVPEGQRSLAFRLVYRVGDRTLTEKDIEPIHNKVRDALMKKFNLTLRS
jgi:phenylalanyl-tRNA synthetase beta chain